MPIYAYRCVECDFAKDVLQRMSDPVLTDCPACGKPGFRKQVTAAGFQLKGTGWYATDFKNSGNKPADSKPAAKNDVAPASAAPAATPAAPAADA